MSRTRLKQFLMAISAGSLSGCVGVLFPGLGQYVQPAYGVPYDGTPPPVVQPEYAVPLYGVVQVKYGAPWVGYDSFVPIFNEQAQGLSYPIALASLSTSSVMVADPILSKCILVRETTTDPVENAALQLVKPTAIAYDASSSLYVVDEGSPALWKIANESATKSLGAETLVKPLGVAAASDIVYISDKHCVRKLDAQGQVTVLAGDPNVSGSGTGSNARFNTPTRLAVGPDGAVYVCDTGNHRVCRINQDGSVSVVAGTGVAGASGDGYLAVNAKLSSPKGIAFDGDGHLYIADTGNKKVRVIQLSTGEIASVNGIGRPTWGIDAMLFNDLADLCVADGHLIVLESSKKLWMCRLP